MFQDYRFRRSQKRCVFPCDASGQDINQLDKLGGSEKTKVLDRGGEEPYECLVVDHAPLSDIIMSAIVILVRENP
jgi:hypothetical protein